MFKKLLIILPVLLALSDSAYPFACLSAPYGWYLEANVGSTKINGENQSGSVSTSGIGGSANFGYKFMPYFAMELGYTYYSNSSVKDQTGTKAASIKNYTYDLASKAIIPYPYWPIELFGKLGIQRMHSHVSITDETAAGNVNISSGVHSVTGLYLGLGGQFYFMPELALVGQWARAYGNSATGTMDLYTVGLSYIFD